MPKNGFYIAHTNGPFPFLSHLFPWNGTKFIAYSKEWL